MTDSLIIGSRSEIDRLIPPRGTFELDPVHTFVTFRARHLVMGRVHGRFTETSGSITVEEDVLESHVEVSIDAGSVSTQMSMRDGHLRSPDFLDVERYPTLTFRSTGVTEISSGQWSIAGDLTIRDVTRPTELIVEFGGAVADPFGNLRLGFHASTSVSRRDFGLLFEIESHNGNVLAARDVAIEIDAEAVRPL